MADPSEKNMARAKARMAEGSGILYGLAVISGTAYPQVKLPTAAGQRGIGFALADTAAGLPVDVQTDGIAIGIASAAIAVDSYVEIAGASGKLRAITAGVTTATHIMGRAKTAAAADGDHISIDQTDRGYAATT